MPEYRVGKPYIPGKRNYPEGCDYNYRSGSHELRLFFANPSKQEIRDVGGEKRFGLFVQGDVIVLLFKIGTMPWWDQPFSFHLTEKGVGPQALPPALDLPEDAAFRALITTILIDADTGIVQAMNAATFSPEFTRALHKAIREQAGKPFPGDSEYNRQVRAIQARYPNSAQLLPLCTAQCVAGKD